MSLNNKQIAVLGLLLAGRSVTDSATAAGVHRVTAQKWLRNPAFASALHEGRKALLSEAHGLVLAHTRAAARTLADLLTSEQDTVRLRAASTLLDLADRHILVGEVLAEGGSHAEEPDEPDS